MSSPEPPLPHPTTFELATSSTRLTVDPHCGNKITSLQNLETGREWLVQADREPATTPAPVFVDNPLCGWDEMFPNVEVDTYTEPPYAGTRLLDHGEVWSRPWRIEHQSKTSIRCSIDGRTLPYTLTRELHLDDATLRVSYELTTHSPDPISVIWAAHPQFHALPATRLTLLNQQQPLRSVPDGEGTIADVAIDPHTRTHVETLVPQGAGMMFYSASDDRIAGVELTDMDSNWLRMTWDCGVLPEFGLWLDHGLYATQTVVCPEPSTGFGTSHAGALPSATALRLANRTSTQWSIEISLGRE